jgi:hypothetical protein
VSSSSNRPALSYLILICIPRRGLIAQGKPPDDSKLVLKVLKSRAPLMNHAWKPERVVRRELRPSGRPLEAPLKQRSPTTKRPKRKPSSTTTAQPLFMSDNMIDNVPGGLKGSVDRLLLVAGLRCFDPDAALCKGRGAFAFRLDSSSDHWRSYLDALSPLIKVTLHTRLILPFHTALIFYCCPDSSRTGRPRRYQAAHPQAQRKSVLHSV